MTVQLGGRRPSASRARRRSATDEYGYDEINLNCGCPSAKVVAKPDADKRFGAALMLDADLVGECLRRMREAVDVPVTLKHRLGVRENRQPDADASTDNYEYTSHFVQDRARALRSGPFHRSRAVRGTGQVSPRPQIATSPLCDTTRCTGWRRISRSWASRSTAASSRWTRRARTSQTGS